MGYLAVVGDPGKRRVQGIDTKLRTRPSCLHPGRCCAYAWRMPHWKQRTRRQPPKQSARERQADIDAIAKYMAEKAAGLHPPITKTIGKSDRFETLNIGGLTVTVGADYAKTTKE